MLSVISCGVCVGMSAPILAWLVAIYTRRGDATNRLTSAHVANDADDGDTDMVVQWIKQ